MDDLLSFSSKAGAELSGWNVSRIFHLNKWLDLVVHHVPILFLDLVVVWGGVALIFSLQTCSKVFKLQEGKAFIILVEGS